MGARCSRDGGERCTRAQSAIKRLFLYSPVYLISTEIQNTNKFSSVDHAYTDIPGIRYNEMKVDTIVYN